ncbi:MAG: hypothetical protein AB1644_08660 [Candidatus Zixiibacteriota bacterium]
MEPNANQSDADGDHMGDVCDSCYACEKTVYLHHANGQKSGDTLFAGTPVRFIFALSGLAQNTVVGIVNALRMYTPDGASWSAPVIDSVNGWHNYFDAAAVLRSSVQSVGNDSLSAGGFAIASGGWPAGLNQAIYHITAAFTSTSNGKHVCIDSLMNYPPYDFKIGGGSVPPIIPYWPGPYCFTIYACGQGLAGNVDCDPSDVVDIGDLSAMVDRLFVTLEPFCCYPEANCDNDAAGEVDIGDVTALVEHLFFGQQITRSCE